MEHIGMNDEQRQGTPPNCAASFHEPPTGAELDLDITPIEAEDTTVATRAA